MSPEAVDQRLREVAQLYKLGVAIRDARRLGARADIDQFAEQGHDQHEKHRPLAERVDALTQEDEEPPGGHNGTTAYRTVL